MEEKENLEKISLSDARKIFAGDMARVFGTAFFLAPLTEWGCRAVYNNFCIQQQSIEYFLLGLWVGTTGVGAIASLIAAGSCMAKQYFTDKNEYFKIHYDVGVNETPEE